MTPPFDPNRRWKSPSGSVILTPGTVERQTHLIQQGWVPENSTFDDWVWLSSVGWVGDRRHLRWGQRAFDLLHQMHPLLAARVTGTSVDPYYDDRRRNEFTDFIQQHWSE